MGKMGRAVPLVWRWELWMVDGVERVDEMIEELGTMGEELGAGNDR